MDENESEPMEGGEPEAIVLTVDADPVVVAEIEPEAEPIEESEINEWQQISSRLDNLEGAQVIVMDHLSALNQQQTVILNVLTSVQTDLQALKPPPPAAPPAKKTRRELRQERRNQ